MFSIVFAFAIPIGLAAYFKKKYNASLRSFLVGCLVWLIFTTILEQGVHAMVFLSPFGEKVQNTVWIMALYGGLMAGLFEETGRFLAMKTILRKQYKNKYNSLMYGAGHGGFEAAFLLGLSMINNFVYAFMVNGGQREALLAEVPSAQKDQLVSIFDSLVNEPSYVYLLGDLERVSAVILHVALSVLVWIAVTKGKTIFYPIAILIHAMVDAVTVFISRGFDVNPFLMEIIILCMSVVAAYYAYRLWKQELCEAKAESEDCDGESVLKLDDESVLKLDGESGCESEGALEGAFDGDSSCADLAGSEDIAPPEV